MMTRLRRYEENVELIFKILYFLLAAGTFCPFIYDSSLQPILVKMVLGVGGILLFLRAADWKALHSYAGTVVDGVVRSEFSIVLLYEQKIWNV